MATASARPRGAKGLFVKVAAADPSTVSAEAPAAPADDVKPKRAPAKRKPIKKKPPIKKKTPLQIVIRVYGTIDQELDKLEAQTGDLSQDRERASRALAQIISTLDKNWKMERHMAKRSRRGAKKPDQEALAHAETLRREIAERIERISRSERDRKAAERPVDS